MAEKHVIEVPLEQYDVVQLGLDQAKAIIDLARYAVHPRQNFDLVGTDEPASATAGGVTRPGALAARTVPAAMYQAMNLIDDCQDRLRAAASAEEGASARQAVGNGAEALEGVKSAFGDIAIMMLSARQLLDAKIAEGTFDQVDQALSALLEKSGWLADRACVRNGGTAVVGESFEDWTKAADASPR